MSIISKKLAVSFYKNTCLPYWDFFWKISYIPQIYLVGHRWSHNWLPPFLNPCQKVKISASTGALAASPFLTKINIHPLITGSEKGTHPIHRIMTVFSNPEPLDPIMERFAIATKGFVACVSGINEFPSMLSQYNTTFQYHIRWWNLHDLVLGVWRGSKIYFVEKEGIILVFWMILFHSYDGYF